ncbi:MAG: PEGA domain-containing protein [Polyangiaceae bacterium]|jgi:hypothetical protein
MAQTPPTPAPAGAPAAPAAAPGAPNPAAAKAALAAGDKAAKAKDWSTALTQYQAAMDAQSSSQALEGVANAQYSLKMQGEAYESYDRFLKDYGTAIGTHSKAQAQARLKELAPLTGYVSIRVNESGADVSLDGKSIGQSPVAALIRVSDGPHKVDVTKAGFTPVTKTPNITGNGKEIVDIQLVHEATTGRISVKEKTGQPVRVLIDGADVGAAPADFEVPPGPHEVVLRSSTLASPAQQVSVNKGETVQVELAAIAASAHIEVTTSDRKGIIFFDAKPVAEGSYVADVAIGPHTIAVTREGYERYEKQVILVDKQSLAEAVTLKLPEAKSTGAAVEERTYDGVYGGLGAMALFEPGGEGNEIDTNCTGLAANSCATSNPVGGGLMAWAGYAWHPVGIEAFLAGEYDEATPSATFIGATTPLENPLAVGEPRVEQFTFIRFGGMGAIRARISAQTNLLRFSFAAGFGLSIKDIFLIRQTQSNSGGQNTYPNSSPLGYGQIYVSPALSGDLSLAIRASKTIAFAVGVVGMFESAGSNLTLPSSSTQALGGGAQPPSPLPTPAYHLATGAQTFIGPYIGLQFGP